MLGRRSRSRLGDGRDVARGGVVVFLLEGDGVVVVVVVIVIVVRVGIGCDESCVVTVDISVKSGEGLAVQSGSTVAVHCYGVDG